MAGLQKLSGVVVEAWNGTRRSINASAKGIATSTETAVSKMGDGLDSVNKRLDKMSMRLNNWADGNRIGRYFRFRERNAKFTVELRAGTITFLMVAYILAVNPNILQTTGGTCSPAENCNQANSELMGAACLSNVTDPLAVECLANLQRNLITATAASSLISTFVIGALANLPLALAPGLGVNAYVAYQVIGVYGRGELTYQQTMATIFVESWIFILLSITGVRGGIIKFMPKTVALASSVGIGLLLAFTGLRNLDVVVFDSSTLVQLGGCTDHSQTYVYSFDAPLTPATGANATAIVLATADVFGCSGGQMRSATMWLGIAGGFISALCLYVGVKGALIIGIAFVTVISWIPGHAATYLGSTSAIPGGEARLQVFRKIVAAPTLDATGLAWSWDAFDTSELWVVLITLLYIDLLDCTGTLLSMAHVLDSVLPGFLDDAGEFPGQMWAFLADGLGILIGSMMGTTPLTVFIESAAGIEDGGRTGLTAITVSMYFFIALFFSPVLASIPPYATGAALVLVGAILIGHVNRIEWDNIGEAIPALLTIILMPMTYSVAYGVISGLSSYIAIHAPFWLWDMIMRRLRPPDEDAGGSSRMRHSNLYIRRKALQGSSFGGNGFGAPSEDESYVTTNSQRSGLPHSISLGMRSVQGLGSPQPSVFEAGEDAAAALANRGRGRSFTNFRMSFDPSPHRAPSPLPLAASRQNSFIAGVLPPGISETELAGLSGPGGRSIRKVVPRPLAQQRTSVSTGVELAPRSGVLRSSKSMGPGVGQAPAAGGFSLFPEVSSVSADAEVPGKAAGGFKLFGDVESPAPPSRPPSPPRPFQLFGDIQPLGGASDDAEAAEEGAGGGSDGTSTSRSEDGSAGGETRDTVASFKAFDLGSQPMMDREGTADMSSFGGSAAGSAGNSFNPPPAFPMFGGAGARSAPAQRFAPRVPRRGSGADGDEDDVMAPRISMAYEGVLPERRTRSSPEGARRAARSSSGGGDEDSAAGEEEDDEPLPSSSGSEGIPTTRRDSYTRYRLQHRPYAWGGRARGAGVAGSDEDDEGEDGEEEVSAVRASRSSAGGAVQRRSEPPPYLGHSAFGAAQRWRGAGAAESSGSEASSDGAGGVAGRSRSASPRRQEGLPTLRGVVRTLSTSDVAQRRPGLPWFPPASPTAGEGGGGDGAAAARRAARQPARRSVSLLAGLWGGDRPGDGAEDASPRQGVPALSPFDVATPAPAAGRGVPGPLPTSPHDEWSMEIRPSGLRMDEEYDSDDGGPASRGRPTRFRPPGQ
ncbi:hypothetical protein ACKKBG_A11660 [Auxenochlorella protothecoides x Auxenochlorella symbiontica]